MSLSTEKIVTEALQLMMDTKRFHPDLIQQYFAEDYLQQVNGETLHYQAFVSHMKTLHTVVKKMRLEIITIASKDDKVLTHHHVYAEKNDGSQSHFEVFAAFLLNDDKIVQCNELTHMVQGAQADRDLGSRHAG